MLGDICASPPAKSPHHMVLFAHSCFQYPSDVNKRKKKNKTRGTHKLCPNDTRKYSHRKCIRHQLCPKPTVACDACKPGWMSLLLCHITNYGSGTESSRYLIASHFPHIVCVEAVTAVYPNSIWNVCGNRTGKHRLLLIFSREVDAKSCVRQQVW